MRSAVVLRIPGGQGSGGRLHGLGFGLNVSDLGIWRGWICKAEVLLGFRVEVRGWRAGVLSVTLSLRLPVFTASCKSEPKFVSFVFTAYSSLSPLGRTPHTPIYTLNP